MSKFIEDFDLNKLTKIQRTHLDLVKKFIQEECDRIDRILMLSIESIKN